MVKSIKIQKNQLVIGEETISLLSGEIHYWRLNPSYWGKCLDRAKEMGLKMLSTYVCWDYHEYQHPYKGNDAKFDFDGFTDPQRNLTGYLELLSEKGFWIIVRPGPYVYTEWPNAGVPRYIAQYHRLHPEFLKAAKRYMGKVVEVIKPYLATNGGRVILFQADNEIDPFVGFHGSQLGLRGGAGLFQDFLEQKYPSVGRLNERWGTAYDGFDEAQAVESLQTKEKGSIVRYLDFRQFLWWYVNKKSKWMVNTYRSLGIDVPIYLNTYPDVWVQNWREMGQIADFVGIDQYPVNEFEESKREQREFLERIVYSRSVCRIPYIAEFESGIWHGYHYSTKVHSANHYRLICLSALQGGVAGWNWYMLVNRDNWYMSPINERGCVRPELFSSFKDVVSIYEQMKPAGLRKMTATAVTYSALYRASSLHDADSPTLANLYDADIDYEFFDYDAGFPKDSDCRLLFYYGCEWLAKKSQQILLSFVEGGGNLVFFTSYPFLDDSMNPLNLLDIKRPDGTVDSRYVEIEIGGRKLRIQSPLFSYHDVPGRPVVAEQVFRHGSHQEETDYLFNLEVGTKYTIGYVQKRGKGTISVFGCHPKVDLIIAIHKHFKIPIFSRSPVNGIHTSIFRSPEKKYYLVVTNNSGESKTAEIELDAKLFSRKQASYRILPEGDPVRVKFEDRPVLYVNLARKDGAVVELHMSRKNR